MGSGMNEGYDIRGLLAQMLGGQAPPPPQFTGTVQLPQFQSRQQQPVPQQQGQGINPMQALNTYNQAAPLWGGQPLWGGAGSVGGGAAPVSGSMSGVGAAANSSSVASTGFGGAGGAAGGSGSLSSALAGAAPWAALALAVIANESKQRGDGNRGNGGWEHFGDIASGKVLERDLDRYLAHNKAGGAAKRAAMMSTPSGIVRNTKDFSGWLKGLFD